MASRWIDVSVPLRTGMVHWPDNPSVSIERTLSMCCGDVCNVSAISMGAHTGTHMDAPLHFIADGLGIDAVPPEAVIGRARVIETQGCHSVRAKDLEPLRLRRGERVLIKTCNSRRCWGRDEFVEDFTFIARDAAEHIAERGVRTVGIDYLSVGGYREDGVETHAALLGAGVWVIEGLNLSAVQPGRYEMIALPLRIAGGDGAPARVLLRPLRRSQ